MNAYILCTALLLMANDPQSAARAANTDGTLEHQHYVVFFASEPPSRQARLSHNFCTFVRSTIDRSRPLAEPVVEKHTISWLPVNGRVRVLKLRAERGRNFSLDESLRLARSVGANVFAYGPYEISAETYANLWRQKQRLEAGVYRYKAIDIRRDNAINCLHAVTLADPKFGGMSVPDRAYGTPVLRHLAQAVNRRQSPADDWVLDQLAIRTGAGIRYLDYNPDTRQHLARVPTPGAPVIARTPAATLR